MSACRPSRSRPSSGVERLVDDLAGQHVLELGAHEGAALAGLDVLEPDDGPQLSVEVEHQPVLQVVGGGHGCLRVLGGACLHGRGAPRSARPVRPGSPGDEILGGTGEHLGRAVGDDERVLDPHTAAAREVDAGLHRDGHARGQAARRRPSGASWICSPTPCPSGCRNSSPRPRRRRRPGRPRRRRPRRRPA